MTRADQMLDAARKLAAEKRAQQDGEYTRAAHAEWMAKNRRPNRKERRRAAREIEKVERGDYS